MSIASVSLAGLTPQLGPPAGPRTVEAGGSAFGGIMERLLGNAADSQQSAQSALRSLAVGDTDNLHAVMLQMAQSDLAFRMVLEVRNRFVDAYQEVMKMQV